MIFFNLLVPGFVFAESEQKNSQSYFESSGAVKDKLAASELNDFETMPHYTYTEEISYDDGNPDRAAKISEKAGHGGAVKMSLPEDKESAMVTSGVFQFWDDDKPDPGGTEFEVEVWDSDEDGEPNERIAGPIEAEAIRDTDTWTEVDLTDEEIVVEDDFFMLFVQTDIYDESPALAEDRTNPSSGRNYIYNGDGEWSPPGNFPVGNYMIRSKVDYEIDQPTITSPEEELITSETEIDVEGEASPGTSIDLTLNDDIVESKDISEDGVFEMENVALSEGENILVAENYIEEDGNEEKVHESEPVTVISDTEEPELTIDSPEDGEVLEDNKVTVEGTVKDDNLDTVEVNNGDVELDGVDYSKNLLLNDGENDITVVAKDKAGHTTTEKITIEIIDDTPTTEVGVEKVWKGKELDTVEVNLLADGDKETSTELTKDEDWKHVFEDLPKENEDDTEIEYTIEEEDLDNYDAAIIGDADEGFTITNTEIEDEPETTEVAVEKVWKGQELADVTIDLLADEKNLDSIELSEKNDWEYEFTDLPKEDEDGEEISYTVEEEDLDDYESKISGDQEDGYTVVNTEIEKEPDPKEIKRINGDLRYDTAIDISRENWAKGELEDEAVVLATGNDFADALAGVPLAEALDTPILLVPSGTSDVEKEIQKQVYNEVNRLDAEKVYILGEKNAVPYDVEKQFENTERLAGDNRVETAVAIADWLVDNQFIDGKKAVVANGYDFPDALSVASSAAQNDLPILLTQTDELSKGTANALEGLGDDEVDVKETYTIGGPKVVSENVFFELPESTRLSGDDRYQTNEAIIEEFGIKGDELYVATGHDYADALTGAVLASQHDSTVVLVQDEVQKVLDRTLDTIVGIDPDIVTIFGGRDAVSDKIQKQLDDALNN